MSRLVPISPEYDRPIRNAVLLQLLIGLLSLLILDGGVSSRVCAVALMAYWSGLLVLVFKRPANPTRIDLELIQYGYIVVIALTALGEWLRSRLAHD